MIHMIPQISTEARVILFFVYVIALLFGAFWWMNRRAKKWLEENGRLKPRTSAPNSLPGSEPKSPQSISLRYSEEEFREMISKVLDELPKKFDKEWKNISVIHSTEWPTNVDEKRMSPLGTYFGHPRTAGIQSNHSAHVIVIYQPALELLCGSDKARLEREIRITVLHELAHYLGMSHQRMKEIGLFP